MIVILNSYPAQELKDWLKEQKCKYDETNISGINIMYVEDGIEPDRLRTFECVEDISYEDEGYKLVSDKSDKKIKLTNGTVISQSTFNIIAGPCSVESEEQITAIAKSVKEAGATILRGGTFKPRTSPYSFQGLKEEGIRYLLEAKKATGMPVVSEITDVSNIEIFKDIDILQIGCRNMQNYELLKAVGQIGKPVILKRGFSATVREWLLSAEYILLQGNPNVILCERGIRTFQKDMKNTVDLAAVAAVKLKTNLPVIVDPSHATGNAKIVPNIALAATAAGADGVMLEVHNEPKNSISDSIQTISVKEFRQLVDKMYQIRKIL